MTVYESLIENFKDIQIMLKDHERLLSSLKKEDNKLVLKRCVSTCPHKRKLKEVLLESIQVLEESKKAFKSKQLETLRKKLTRILAEID